MSRRSIIQGLVFVDLIVDKIANTDVDVDRLMDRQKYYRRLQTTM